MKPVDVKPSTCIDSSKETINKDPKFKVVIHVRVSRYKNIFAKVYVPNRSEEIFVITKVKNIVSWTYVISDLKGEEIVGTFYKKELKKTTTKKQTNKQTKTKNRIEKVIKRKGNKLYVKWRSYDNSSNSWIDKKDIV